MPPVLGYLTPGVESLASILGHGWAVLSLAELDAYYVNLAMWIARSPFQPVYQTSSGIGGYDLRSPADQAFAFDYDGTGKLDHLVFYRPGTGAIFILKKAGATFTPVFISGNPATGVYNGIGGYDLKSPADRGFAFDYDGTGKLDHPVFYRPGTGAIFILKKAGATFMPVFISGNSAIGVYDGIGGYDLKSPADRAFAFDYDGSGKTDYLVFSDLAPARFGLREGYRVVGILAGLQLIGPWWCFPNAI
jgi:hypothetical protein